MNVTAALAAVLIAAGGVQPAADSDLVVQPSGDPGSITSPIAGGGVQPAKGPGVTIGKNCYSWSPACTMVFSRSATKHTIGPAASGVGNGLLASIVGLCTAARGKEGGSLCAAIFGAYNGASQAAISQAAANNQCASYTTYFSESLPGVWRTNNGPDCHD